MCLFLSRPEFAKAILINASFETPEVTGGSFPTTFGDWGGDLSQIVTAENGITPFDGSRMLRFDGTATDSSDFEFGDVFQLVDMSPFSAIISTGLAVATGSAFFNRVAGTNQTDTHFEVEIRAFAGLPSNFGGNSPDPIASNTGVLLSDDKLDTWESAMVQLLLPVATTHLAFKVAAFENISDPGLPEFDGHYADSAFLSVTGPAPVPEPSTMLLLGFGLAGLGFFRRLS